MSIQHTDFLRYEAVILDGQVSQSEASRLLDENPEFAAWYQERARERAKPPRHRPQVFLIQMPGQSGASTFWSHRPDLSDLDGEYLSAALQCLVAKGVKPPEQAVARFYLWLTEQAAHSTTE